MEYSEANPYAAPSAVLKEPGELAEGSGDLELRKASRGRRFVAWLLDSFITGGSAALIAVVVVIVITVMDKIMNQVTQDIVIGGDVLGGALLGCVLALIINGVLLHQNGQTVGKLIMGIKVARTDGSRTSLRRIFGLRFLPIALGNILMGIIGLIDALMIFGASRRCLHDRIADTIVIRAR
jgi:uncharacterized RDD family membrane protein YckC